MNRNEYRGLLCIGDPHLAARAPGERIDDYARAILDKLSFGIDLARHEQLLPAILGDVFHAPDEAADRWYDELADLFAGEVIGVFGNHDCSGDELAGDDALARLASSGAIHLLDRDRSWRGWLGGRPAMVGGSPWGRAIPSSVTPEPHGDLPPAALAIWLTHADLRFPGSAASGIEPHEIPGVDLVVNGHMHTPLPPVEVGATTWCNPGSISRYSGSESARRREPAALRVAAGPNGLALSRIAVPHKPAHAVFPPADGAG
jgi:predicted phosphodiesterase